MNEPVFARSAMGGKRTARVEARVTDETKFALAQRCHQKAYEPLQDERLQQPGLALEAA